MTMTMRTALRVGCALLLLVGLAQAPALADCPGQTAFFGNFGGATFLQLDVADPAAGWAMYIFENPAINQGSVPVGATGFDLGSGTFIMFADWGGGLGLTGCPFSLDLNPVDGSLDNNPIHQVTIAYDSRGATIVVNGSEFNVFDFDKTLPAGGQLPVTNLKPHIVNAVTGASVTLDLEWAPPVVLSDSLPGTADIAGRIISGYRILQRRTSSTGSTDSEVADQDGSTTDNRARVVIEQETGVKANLFVEALLAGTGGPMGGSLRGSASSEILLTPGLAIPGKGKGKGLEKAPGQNK